MQAFRDIFAAMNRAIERIIEGFREFVASMRFRNTSRLPRHARPVKGVWAASSRPKISNQEFVPKRKWQHGGRR